MSQILFIHPPIAKACEPPAGIARIKAVLQQHNISSTLIDANVEGIHYLLQTPLSPQDTRSSRAFKNINSHLTALKNGSTFKSIDHYNRIINDLNHILFLQGKQSGYILNLADCTHQSLSPLSVADLLECAKNPQANPFYDYYLTTLLPKIEEHNPAIIGLSLNFLNNALCGFALIGLIKNHFPKIKICLGGGLITSWITNSSQKTLPSFTAQFQGLIDYAIAGPGEPFFLALLKKITTPYTWVFPNYSDFNFKNYLSPQAIIPYNTSTGCYWKQCNFCPEQTENNRYSPLSTDTVSKDLKLLSQQTDKALIHFLDNALSPKMLKHFCKVSPPFPWYGYVRFTKELSDLNFCLQLKKSGCVMLKLGLESGDQEVLNNLKKGIELGTVSTILHNLKEVGINTYIYLLFGTPYDQKSTTEKTIDFVTSHHESITYLNAAIFNMPLYAKETNTLPTTPFSQTDLSLYTNFTHPNNWNRTEIRHFLDRDFKRHPLINVILNRTPKTFTSNHAAFFNFDKYKVRSSGSCKP